MSWQCYGIGLASARERRWQSFQQRSGSCLRGCACTPGVILLTLLAQRVLGAMGGKNYPPWNRLSIWKVLLAHALIDPSHGLVDKGSVLGLEGVGEQCGSDDVQAQAGCNLLTQRGRAAIRALDGEHRPA
jgi:hypothetical protein